MLLTNEKTAAANRIAIQLSMFDAAHNARDATVIATNEIAIFSVPGNGSVVADSSRFWVGWTSQNS